MPCTHRGCHIRTSMAKSSSVQAASHDGVQLTEDSVFGCQLFDIVLGIDVDVEFSPTLWPTIGPKRDELAEPRVARSFAQPRAESDVVDEAFSR